jgi:hypothetical protein
VVGGHQQGRLIGDVGEGGQHGGDAVLSAVGEVFDVLVQGGQAQTVGQVDGDERALVEMSPSGMSQRSTAVMLASRCSPSGQAVSTLSTVARKPSMPGAVSSSSTPRLSARVSP